MNAFALLDNGSFAVPFNPEVCWWICLALLHTSWQALVVGLLAVGFARDTRFSVHSRFKIAFSAMILIGCLPLGNYFWISQSAAPEAVSVASQQFAVTGSVSLFLPSELRVSPQKSTTCSAHGRDKSSRIAVCHWLLESQCFGGTDDRLPSGSLADDAASCQRASQATTVYGLWKIMLGHRRDSP